MRTLLRFLSIFFLFQNVVFANSVDVSGQLREVIDDNGKRYQCLISSGRVISGTFIRGRFVSYQALIKKAKSSLVKAKKTTNKHAVLVYSKLLKRQQSEKSIADSLCNKSNTPTITPTITPTVSPTPVKTYSSYLTPTYPQYKNSSMRNGASFVRATPQEILDLKNRIVSQSTVPHLIDPQRIQDIKEALLSNSDPILTNYWRRTLNHVIYNIINLNPPFVTCIPGDYSHNLQSARTALTNINYLAFAYRMQGDQRFLDRAKQELYNITVTCTEWSYINQSSAHIAGEFTTAAALGYDLLYSYLSPHERVQIEDAILLKGIIPMRDIFRVGCPDPWTCQLGETNWFFLWSGGNIEMVSMSGVSLGALMIGKLHPDESAEVLANVIKNIPNAFNQWGDDGGHFENIGYSQYGLSYAVRLINGLRSTLNEDFGIQAAQGFSQAGDYIIHAGGAKPNNVNYGDSTWNTVSVPELFWLAREFQDPLYSRWALELSVETAKQGSWTRRSPEDLLYYYDLGKNFNLDATTRTSIFGIHQFFTTSSWTDPSALRASLKGGVNRWNHNDQLDNGAFFIEYGKENFVVDPGYGVSGTSNHSTLLFNGLEQGQFDKAGFITRSLHPEDPFAILDLSRTNSAIPALGWKRGLWAHGGTEIRLQDEFTAPSGTTVTWQIKTIASVSIRSNGVYLEQNGKAMYISTISPSTVLWELHVPNNASLSNPKNLSFTLPGTGSLQRVAVSFTTVPIGAINPGQVSTVAALSNWWN